MKFQPCRGGDGRKQFVFIWGFGLIKYLPTVQSRETDDLVSNLLNSRGWIIVTGGLSCSLRSWRCILTNLNEIFTSFLSTKSWLLRDYEYVCKLSYFLNTWLLLKGSCKIQSLHELSVVSRGSLRGKVYQDVIQLAEPDQSYKEKVDTGTVHPLLCEVIHRDSTFTGFFTTIKNSQATMSKTLRNSKHCLQNGKR